MARAARRAQRGKGGRRGLDLEPTTTARVDPHVPRLARAATAVGLVVVALAPSAPGSAQAAGFRYTYFLARGQADGLTTTFTIDALLPVDELVGLSSVTSESHLGVGRSDSLAALPDPGDLVLSLPGTLSALTGIPGLPDYPAASRAEHPSIPSDDVQLVPDAGLGAGALHTEADEDHSGANASVTSFKDTVGLLPGFSVGSVATSSTSRRIDPATFEAKATTTLSDVHLLGSLVRIDQITTVATARVQDDRLTAEASEVTVSGAEVAGTPVGIGPDGIVGLGEPRALAPIVDTLVAPLRQAGITLRTTPKQESVDGGTATATGGALELDMPIVVSGRPGKLVVTLGSATAELSVAGGGTPAAVTGPVGATTSGTTGTASPAARPATASSASAPPATGRPSAPAAAPPGGAGGQQLVSVPGRSVLRWDVRSLYRAIAAAGLLMLLSRRLLHRLGRASGSSPTNQLRPLWRW